MFGMGKKRPAVKPAGPRPLATLDAEELRKVQEQRRVLRDHEMTLSMLRASYRVLWAALAAKHKLPAEVELDEATGEVFAKPQPTPADG